MAQKPEDNKKDKKTDNKIREGSADEYSINQEKKATDERSYPKPSDKDTQYKDQPEFIDNEPNRKNEPE